MLMEQRDQLNLLDKDKKVDLEKKQGMLQDELHVPSELEEDRKMTNEDWKREDLLVLEEFVECVQKRNQLVSTDFKIINPCHGWNSFHFSPSLSFLYVKED